MSVTLIPSVSSSKLISIDAMLEQRKEEERLKREQEDEERKANQKPTLMQSSENMNRNMAVETGIVLPTKPKFKKKIPKKTVEVSLDMVLMWFRPLQRKHRLK